MSGLLRAAAALAVCTLLDACSVGIGRGVDPRDSGGASSAVAGNNNMGVPGAISLFSGPALLNWLTKAFMPDQHSDVPPPPSPRAGADRAAAGQD